MSNAAPSYMPIERVHRLDAVMKRVSAAERRLESAGGNFGLGLLDATYSELSEARAHINRAMRTIKYRGAK